MIAKVNERLPEDQQIVFPDLSGLSKSEAGKRLDKWASDLTDKHFELLQHHIELKLDAKRTTPQRLYGFVLEHPELFKNFFTIIPPA